MTEGGAWQSEPWQRGSIHPSFPPSFHGRDTLPRGQPQAWTSCSLGASSAGNPLGIPLEQAGAVGESRVPSALVPSGGGPGTLLLTPAENSTSRQERTHQGQELPAGARGGTGGLEPAGCSSRALSLTPLQHFACTSLLPPSRHPRFPDAQLPVIVFSLE